MSTKDPRVKRTIKLLSETLIEMVSEIGYEQVQVSDLVIRAGVSKSTFYRHFLDKEGLLKHVLMESMQAMINRMLSARSNFEEVLICFQHFRGAYHDHTRLYLNLPINSPPRQMIRSVIKQMFWDRYQPLDTDPQLKDMALNHIIASTDALLEWYLDNLDKCTPEEAARMFAEIIIRAAVRVAFEPREEWLRRFD